MKIRFHLLLARADAHTVPLSQARSSSRSIVRSRFVGVGVLALASGARLSIALAAQRLNQGVELVFNHADSAGAYLHEAEPSGFYEIFVECSLADAEPRQYLALSQNSLADHMGGYLRSNRDVRGYQRIVTTGLARM